jgi:hypothetical protein
VTGRRLAGAQYSAPASAVPVGSFVYDGVSLMWVEVVAVSTALGRTMISVIEEHDVPLEYRADDPVAVCDAFTVGTAHHAIATEGSGL